MCLWSEKVPNNRNLITEHTHRRDIDTAPLVINAIVHELAPPRHKIHPQLKQRMIAARLDNDIEAIRILRLEARPLLSLIGTAQLEVFMCAVKILGELHLGALM